MPRSTRKAVLDRNGAQVAGDEWYQPGQPPDARPDVQLDTTVPHIARIYDFWLGGKDNFEVDRAAGQRAMDANPSLYQGVKGNRAFLARTVRYLAGQQGIRQFLDIGTGIPTANNTHEVAQSVAPQSRVVYVDNDPIVLTHARALLTSSTAPTSYVDADARDTGKILAAAAETLDLSQPVGLMMIAVLHCIPDDSRPLRPGRRTARGPARWELPDHLAPGQRHQYRCRARDAGPAQRDDAGQTHLPQPPTGRALLCRAGPDRAGGGPDPGVAARLRPGPGQPG